MQNRRKERGFTLVEIMVVVVILGMLATLVLPNVIGNQARAQKKKALADLAQIDGVAKNYYINTNRVPEMQDLLAEDENGHKWLEGYEEAPKDPWGNDYYIAKLEGTGKFAVFSMGPDGIDETEDDLRSDRKDQ